MTLKSADLTTKLLLVLIGLVVSIGLAAGSVGFAHITSAGHVGSVIRLESIEQAIRDMQIEMRDNTAAVAGLTATIDALDR